MKRKLIDFLIEKYKDSNNEFEELYSIRWLSWKLELPKSQIEHIIHWLAGLGVITSKQGSKNLINIPLFYSHFVVSAFDGNSVMKNSDNIKRKIINVSKEKYKDGDYDITFKREIYKDDKLVAISNDTIYKTNINEEYIEHGFHNLIRKELEKNGINYISQAEVTDCIIDLKGIKEYKKIGTDYALFQTTKIKNPETGELIGQSFSIMPADNYVSKYIKIFV